MRSLCAGVLGAVLLVSVLSPGCAVAQASDMSELIERGEAAGLPASMLESVVERANQRGVSAEDTYALIEPSVEIAESNLPATALLTKVMEGLSKNVPPTRMQPVLETLRTQTQEAGSLIDAWLATEEGRTTMGINEEAPSTEDRTALIRGVTAARQQNLAPEVTESWLTTLPGGASGQAVSATRIEAALRILPQLPEADQPGGIGHQLAHAAVHAVYQPSQIRQLPQALERAHQQGDQPLSVVARRATGAIGMGHPASVVLDALVQGQVPSGPPVDVGPPDRRSDPPGPPDGPPDERPDPPGEPPA